MATKNSFSRNHGMDFLISSISSCCNYKTTKLIWSIRLLLILSYFSCCCGGELNNRINKEDGGTFGEKLKSILTMDSYMNSILEWKSELGLSEIRIIPNHHYVSAFLNGGISKRFLYINENPGNILSILVTPCTSVLMWTVKYWPMPTQSQTSHSNFTNFRSKRDQEPELLKVFRTERSATFYDLKSRRGVYTIDMKALNGDSYVHLYALSGVEPLRIPSNFIETSNINPGVPKPKINQRRLRGNRLHIKWEPSPYNPQNMKYCIVVSAHRDYSTLCQAKGEKYGVLPPDLTHVSYYYFPVQKRKDYYSSAVQSDDDSDNGDGDADADDRRRNLNDGVDKNVADNLNVMMDQEHDKNSDDDDVLSADINGRKRTGSRDYINSNHIEDSQMELGQLGYHHPKINQPTKGKMNMAMDSIRGSQTYAERERARDIIIGCVNRKTSYILNNLREGKLYYFNVFIKDSTTNLTYPYLRTTIKYQGPKHLPNGITDSKAKKVMVSGDGKPTLIKFNLKNPCSELSIYVMPCQGGRELTYQIIHAYKSIIESTTNSLDIIKIARPSHGRYYIRIRQTYSSTSNSISPTLLNSSSSLSPSSSSSSSSSSSNPPRMVELYVSKRNKRFPLPKLPKNTHLTEDVSERSCDSIRILWYPSPERRDNEYCIFLKEESRKLSFNFKKPNQCDVERSLNSDPYVTHSMCIQRTSKSPSQYLSQTIGGLEPGKIYIVQLIVRRHKGKALSYDLLQVSTLSQCTDPITYGYY